jgi:hypothetical protein
MITPPEPSSGRPEAPRGRFRFGLRRMLVAVLLIGLPLGSVARHYHDSTRTGRILGELRGESIVPVEWETTWLGGWIGLLPQSAKERLHREYGDRFLAICARPIGFTAVLVGPGQLGKNLARLGRLGGVRSLTLPSGLSEAELREVRAVLPEAEIVVAPTFKHGKFSIKRYDPTRSG